MIELDHPVWNKLRTAFGTAEEVPELLTSLLHEYDQDTWEELIELLLHQYTIYDSTLAAMPYIAQIAQSAPLAIQKELYITCGMIEVSYHSSSSHLGQSVDTELWKQIQQEYDTAVKQWDSLHKTLLDHGKQDAEDIYEQEYLLAAWLAYHGHYALAELFLYYTGGEEYEGVCPLCQESFYAVVSDADGSITLYADDPVFNQEVDHTTVTPDEIPSHGAWHDCQLAAQQLGADSLLERLTFMNGHAECPHCHQMMSVAESLVSERSEL